MNSKAVFNLCIVVATAIFFGFWQHNVAAGLFMFMAIFSALTFRA